MATTKNITMKQFNGTDYDTLYPKTVYNQVSGVAPAGYGLGAKDGKLITDGNDALVGGWFYWGNIDTNLPSTYGHMRVDPRISTSNGQTLMQTAYSDNYQGCVAQRKMVDGAFKPWEWVNPPMKLGVEYRTTERYLGKPVYVKLVDCGALPNSASKSISISDDTTVRCFDIVTGTNSSGMVLPTACFGGLNLDREVAITSNGSSILIVTNFDGSSYTNTYVLVKYYKTTD